MDVFSGNIGAGLIEAGSAKDLQQGQQDWLTEMSNTAYQRQVADMKAAGLNPMLAATKGGGASTPNAPVAKPPGSALAGAISTGLAQMQNQQSINNDTVRVAQEGKLKDAQGRAAEQESILKQNEAIKTRYDTEKSAFEKEKLRQDMIQNEKVYKKNLEMMDAEKDFRIASSEEVRRRAENLGADTMNKRADRNEKEFKSRAWGGAIQLGDELDKRLQSNSVDKFRPNPATATW